MDALSAQEWPRWGLCMYSSLYQAHKPGRNSPEQRTAAELQDTRRGRDLSGCSGCSIQCRQYRRKNSLRCCKLRRRRTSQPSRGQTVHVVREATAKRHDGLDKTADDDRHSFVPQNQTLHSGRSRPTKKYDTSLRPAPLTQLRPQKTFGKEQRLLALGNCDSGQNGNRSDHTYM